MGLHNVNSTAGWIELASRQRLLGELTSPSTLQLHDDGERLMGSDRTLEQRSMAATIFF